MDKQQPPTGPIRRIIIDPERKAKQETLKPHFGPLHTEEDLKAVKEMDSGPKLLDSLRGMHMDSPKYHTGVVKNTFDQHPSETYGDILVECATVLNYQDAEEYNLVAVRTYLNIDQIESVTELLQPVRVFADKDACVADTLPAILVIMKTGNEHCVLYTLEAFRDKLTGALQLPIP